MIISDEKQKHLEKLSDERGVISALALDQRGSLRKALASVKEINEAQISPEDVSHFKEIVVEALSPFASGVLLDTEYGLPAAKKRAEKCGLLLAYEKSGYDNTKPGRLPDLLPDLSAKKIKEVGADAVKLLVYYTPFEEDSINIAKQDFVAQIGKECAQADIPFFLEFVGYDYVGNGEKDISYAKKKPEIVTKSILEFSQERYLVDVLKVEIPINMKYVSETKSFGGESAYTRAEALSIFKESAVAVDNKPFIYLSAGVPMAEFLESLELAAEAQVPFNGVLCGRATWIGGVKAYADGGEDGLKKWLAEEGKKNIIDLNNVLKEAKPWKK